VQNMQTLGQLFEPLYVSLSDFPPFINLIIQKFKKEWNVVRELRNTSGMHYDDVRGAVVNDKNTDVWKGLCRVCATFPLKIIHILIDC